MDEKMNMTPLDGATPEELANAIAEILDSKKGRDIKVLPVSGKTDIAEFFVLCSGTSNTHIKALAEEVEYAIGLRGVKPLSYEGRNNNSWILIDYASVVVHVFSRDARAFYNLDKLYKEKTTTGKSEADAEKD